MKAIKASSTAAGLRGPLDHSIRDQIVHEAHIHFMKNGYGKTTVSELAKAIGFSKAYIYKFFESKQAIGQAICMDLLEDVYQKILAEVAGGRSASDKLRRMFRVITAEMCTLFIEDEKLHDIALYSWTEKWPSHSLYNQRLHDLVQEIVTEGRASGEFERKTPLDEICRSVLRAMYPFIAPVMIQHSLDHLPEGPNETLNLILRSLAP